MGITYSWVYLLREQQHLSQCIAALTTVSLSPAGLLACLEKYRLILKAASQGVYPTNTTVGPCSESTETRKESHLSNDQGEVTKDPNTDFWGGEQWSGQGLWAVWMVHIKNCRGVNGDTSAMTSVPVSQKVKCPSLRPTSWWGLKDIGIYWYTLLEILENVEKGPSKTKKASSSSARGEQHGDFSFL